MIIEDRLILLIEECGEVIQAATKCLRFGYAQDHRIGYGKNNEVLSREIGDLLGVIDSIPLIQPLVENARITKMERAEKAKALYGK